MPPDENLPGPPQPGRPAPRVRNGEPPQFQTENPGNGMNRQFAFNRFNGSSTEEYFRTRQRNEFIYVDPKPEEITPAQKNWLRNHLNEFESVLYGPGFRDPAKGYAAYIDPLSFIDHHLMVEVTKNIDGFRFSTFYSKDRGGKIQMQPIWDWNLSFGNANGKQGWMAEFWYWPQLDDNQYTWFRRLFEDPEFGQRYVDRWGELRTTVFSLTNLMVRIDGLVADLGEARVRNFKRWPILNRKIWPNTFQGETYEDEIRFLKDFTRKRLAWIDAQFVAAPVATREGARLVKLSAARGKIYFTTDGSDPRAVGGSPGPGARPYTEPVQLPASSSQVAAAPAPARLVARALFDNRWSPPTRL